MNMFTLLQRPAIAMLVVVQLNVVPSAAPQTEHSDGSITVEFCVTDVDGKPVSGALVAPKGFAHWRDRIQTDQKGIATWEASKELLIKLSNQNKRVLRFTVLPPKGSVMLQSTRLIRVDELLKRPKLDFRMHPGVRIVGRVIGKTDRAPIAGINLRIRPLSEQATGLPAKSCDTNKEGEWSLIIPPVDAAVTVVGERAGYVLRGNKHDSSTVIIRDGVSEIRVPDFEIEQIPPVRVVVLDAWGETVRGARVSAQYHRWLTDDFVMVENLADQQPTNLSGQCSLVLLGKPWKSAEILAEHLIGGVRYSGRSPLRLGGGKPIQVVLRRPVQISGRVMRRGKPAGRTSLVLYEVLETNNSRRGWVSIRLVGEATSDTAGKFSFFGEPTVDYVIASKRRDKNGEQTVLHKIAELASANYQTPDLVVP